MCCCLAGFIVKYVLIIANIIFALAGLAILGLGVAAHIQIKELAEILPVNLTALSISIIILGCIVFVISGLACCGAMQESRCMLITYSVFMAILAGVKIYLTVVIFNFLDSALSTVDRWIISAFDNNNVRPAFHAMETLFSCCGTTGAGSYTGIYPSLPASCCALPDPIDSPFQCTTANAFDGCSMRVGNYFETFGEAIGAVLIVVIIIELVCVLFGSFLSCQIRQKRYASA